MNPNLFFAQPLLDPNAPGALAPALTLAAKQKQQASQAASALARKSHPQTLLQPPKRPPQPQVQPQNTPNQAPQQPPPPQLGAPSPGAPAQPPPGVITDRIKGLQDQLAAMQKQESSAYGVLQNAMAQPQPPAPTYTQPTMQQANPGLAIGAALAALFAPKYSQGAIGALGVDQANREKAYDQATEAAKNQYQGKSDLYQARSKERQEAIENAERLDTAAGRNVGQLNTQIDTEINREQLAGEKAATLEEAKQKEADLQKAREWRRQEFLSNFQQRERFHNDLVNEFGQRMGIDQGRLDAIRGSLVLRNKQFMWDMKRFGLSQEQAANLAGMRTAAMLVMQTDRDTQKNNSDAVRVATQGARDLNTLITQLATHNQGPQAAAIAQRLKDYAASPQGQRLNAALQQFGVSGDMASNLLDEEANVDEVLPAAENSEATPSGTPPIQVYFGDQQPGGSGAAPGGKTAEQLLQEVQQLAPKLSGQSGAPAGGGGAQGDPIAQQFHEDLPQVLPLWQKALTKHGGDANAAWAAIAPGFEGSDPREISMIRRELFNRARGGRNQGNAPAPARGNPSLNQALTGVGISPALLPQ